ncbi:DNA (cytosine-5-)-methyltransferase [Capnocytophaga gingivalis]|jgi:modification methylase rho11sI|uniref:DNA (cytosine-5-)-methyltransferase n=2 Tax=Capnocytophaga gingivalis TaxID=1017 RepID=UPI0023F7B62F|nr:DNA (cytosine-5-)-methyltransferase [Capnocytophaga gingivalis]
MAQMEINKMRLRIFEGFAGYGGASFALRKLKEKYPQFKYEVVGYSEIDKFASSLFDVNHKGKQGNPIKNWGDITLIDPYELPDFDMFTGGFPCQPFSSAGMMKGEEDPYGRGTLFQHIMRICEVKKPKYILMENVKGLKSKKFERTRALMEEMLRDMGYVTNIEDKNEQPLASAILNSKDYGIAQNRERLWMFAQLGGLPQNFCMTPPPIESHKRLADFLDPDGYVPKAMYLSEAQIEHLKIKHNIPHFNVDRPLCLDIYNKKIKYDGYSITITQPEHNSLRIIESHKDKEVVRKMSVTEQFRLMGLEGLQGVGRKVDIDFAGQSYSQLSKRAGNGWDVNLVTILLEHIFKQL